MIAETFGPIVGVDNVRDWVKDHLVLWSATYIAETARQRGLAADALPNFQLFEIVGSDVLEHHDQLPALQIECPQIMPQRRSPKKVRGVAEVIIRVYAGAVDRESTTQLVGRLVAAVRSCMEQHPTLGGRAAEVVWQGDRIEARARGERYEIWDGRGLLLFDVSVDPLMDLTARPAFPDDPLPPPDPLPAVTSAHITPRPQERT